MRKKVVLGFRAYALQYGAWELQQKLSIDFVVALDGPTTLIGVSDDKAPSGVSAGAAYVYEREGDDGNRVERQRLAAENTTDG